MAQTQQDFSLRFFQTYNEMIGQKNFVVSPYALATNLTMLANGAEGETLAELLDVLGYDASQLTDANSLARAMIDQLPYLNKDCYVTFAASVWTTPGIDLNSDFASRMEKYFDAKSFTSTPSALAADVNKWVASNTSGKITNLLDETSMHPWFIANTMQFDGKWTNPFHSDEEINFKNEDGSTHRIKGMKGYPIAKVHEWDDYDIVEINYGNGQFRMFLIVPDVDVPLDDVINRYCSGEKGGRTANMHVELTMPQFTIDFADDMIPALKAMGINRLFSLSECDLSKMSKNVQNVEIVRQGTKLTVDKSGTKYETATASGGLYPLCNTIDTGILVVDRPFAFVIKEIYEGPILLAGKITKL